MIVMVLLVVSLSNKFGRCCCFGRGSSNVVLPANGASSCIEDQVVQCSVVVCPLCGSKELLCLAVRVCGVFVCFDYSDAPRIPFLTGADNTPKCRGRVIPVIAAGPLD